MIFHWGNFSKVAFFIIFAVPSGGHGPKWLNGIRL